MDGIIQLHNIRKKFNVGTVSETVLYEDLNLDVKQGDFVTVIGSNGSGKSTLLNVICGQVESDGGDVIFEGTSILKKPDFKRFQNISRVYQDPQMGTSPSLTVRENLALSELKGKLFNLKSLGHRTNEKKYVEMLSQLNMGLEDKLDVKVGLLSGGQRQALSLLMASMNNPHLLLLDEHTAALDPKSSEAIMNLTDKMIRERDDLTVIMVTHNLNHALRFGNRLIMFHGGDIVEDFDEEEKSNLNQQDLMNLFMQYEYSFSE